MTSVVISFAFCNFLNLGRYTLMDTKTTPIEILVENNFKGKSNYLTSSLLDCMGFWNREGMIAVAKNRSGEWGGKATQELANRVPADDFLLEMMLTDCKTFVNSDFAKNSPDTYECGRTRSHVWVHMNDKRIFMFHTNVPV
jgi:hypothetical protein